MNHVEYLRSKLLKLKGILEGAGKTGHLAH